MPNEQSNAALEARLRKIELLLNAIIFTDKYYFNKDISLKEGARIIPVGVGGLRIGNSSSSHIGFFGETPVDQPAAIEDPAMADISGSDMVSDSAIQSNFTILEGKIEDILARLRELGLIAT